MTHSESIKELAAALAKAQGELAGAKKDVTNTFFKNRYADLASTVDALKAAFPKHGLSYVQTICTEEHGAGVITMLLHESGEWIKGDKFCLPVNKADAQGFGSCVTYARRYSLAAIAGVAPEDDDGNAAVVATPRKPDTATQVTHDAYADMPPEAKQIVREWAMEVIGIMEDAIRGPAERIDAAARFVLDKTQDGSDQEGLLALSSQLESKVRNPIKLRMQEIHRERKNGGAKIVVAPGTKPVAALASQA